MKFIFIGFFIGLSAINTCFAQNIVICGKVIDAKTKQPLISANIGIIGFARGAISDAEGIFKLSIPNKLLDDTLFISYVGYRTLKKAVSAIPRNYTSFALEEVAILLDEVTILEQHPYKFESKKTEASMKQVKGNLYASSTEVTNAQYNQFLNHLIRNNQKSLYEKYKPDISHYEGTLLAFFKGYHIPHKESKDSRYTNDFNENPVVNISYESAVAYCEWLTEQYNNQSGKKKFHKVTFRLPTLKEWQIAALGYKKFQSWNIEENEVEVGIPKHPGEEIGAKKIMMKVKDNDILYPWFGAHDYRDKAQNSKNCWMGNFKIPEGSDSCFIARPAGDGYFITAKVASYFPNGMGLYDVVGNVEEMIDEKGKACGGSWAHLPEESTMTSVHSYLGASGTVGFRVFMVVVSER
ncbi:MAG TPA: SUMF1/EgtB/PvdO family nonheme iron enzyme [Cyclobacteriaceae bacterium]|nr:SUMF1/EgtB/PvdO family nonheme iron enzyme [Cyclobacteriaceae bacterium]